jgi:hypothetical protein
VDAAQGKRLVDFGAAAREVLDRRPRDPLDVGVAVAGQAPLHAELAGELGPELGLEDVAGGLGVQIEGRAPHGGGEREPAAVALGPGQVGDEDVGVEGGVAGPRHAVAEGHRDEALAPLDLLAAPAALNEAGLGLEVADAGGDGAVVGPEDLLADPLVAEGVDQQDRLPRGEADVVGEHRLLGALAPGGVGEGAGRRAAHQHPAGAGVAALEDGGVGGAVDAALEAELLGLLAEPLTRGLAGLRVVVLGAVGHGLDPVAGVGALDLASEVILREGRRLWVNRDAAGVQPRLLNLPDRVASDP